MLFESTPLSSWVFDLNTHVILAVNDAAVRHYGYTRAEFLTLRIEDRLRLDFTLKVGQVSDKVEVTAEAPLLQTENNTLGRVIDENSIKQLPLSGRRARSLPAIEERPGIGTVPEEEKRDQSTRCALPQPFWREREERQQLEPEPQRRPDRREAAPWRQRVTPHQGQSRKRGDEQPSDPESRGSGR